MIVELQADLVELYKKFVTPKKKPTRMFKLDLSHLWFCQHCSTPDR